MANSAMSAGTPAEQLNARFTEIYGTYLPRITALVDSRIFDDADKHLTDDLTAEAFTQIWLHLHKCEATTEAKLFSWLATVARRTVADHFRVKKNTMERPVDTGDFQFANRDLVPAGGYYTPSRNGFRTATWDDNTPAIPRLPIPGPRGPVDHDGDSDPDANELLRRAREARRPRALVGA